jgi:predicted ATPase
VQQRRAQQELKLQSALSVSLTATRGYTAPEVGKAYTRARELCRQLGDTPQLFSVLYGLWVFHLVRAELQTAYELGEQLLNQAQRQHDPALALEAHQALGISLFYRGELVSARKHLEQGIALYDPKQHRSLAFLHGHDHGVACLSYEAWVLWLLGYPNQAQKRSHEALSLALELAHPFSLAFALNFASLLHHHRREGQAAHEQAQALVKLSLEQGFAFYFAHGTILRGGALAEQEQEEGGIAQILQGLNALQATGAELRLPYYFAALAVAHARVQQVQKAFALLTKALDAMHRNEERVHEAELYRIKGELSLQSRQVENKSKTSLEQIIAGQDKSDFTNPQSPTPNPQPEAEACFHQAINIARKQQAKLLELRAAMSLGRLWQQQGKTKDARQLLEEIYGWFTEGFETKDLQDAEALLTALGGKVERAASVQHSLLTVQRSPTVPQEFSFAEARTVDDTYPTPGTQHQTSSTFRQEGEYWTLTFQGITCRVKDTRGLQYIAQLLRYPHHEFHVLALVSGDVSLAAIDRPSHQMFKRVDTANEPESVYGGGFTDVGDMLDPQAKAAYKQRLQGLQAELEEARGFNDPGRAEKIQEEIDFLTQELVHAVGLGGRSRKAASPAERARVNVTRAIKTAIRKITESHPALGQHLAHTIKTGTFCAYTPDPHLSLSWQL